MKHTIYIEGMSCVACEKLLRKSCGKISGCQVHEVSHKKWRLECECDNITTLKKIEQAIVDHGYKVSDGSNKVNPWKAVWTKSADERIEIAVILVIAIVVVMLLSDINIYQYLPSFSNEVSIGVAILVWLVASVSSCLAVVWWVVIGFSEYIDKSSSRRWRLRVQISFQLGRIIGFAVLGAILWLLGNVISINLWAQWLLNIIVGIVFVYMWLYMFGLLPNITQLGFHLPSSWTDKLDTTKSTWYAPIIGALTFFLPCWFTQSMQVMALWSWDPLQWALIMWAFAIGTAPALLAVWLGSSYIKGTSMKMVNRVIGCLIVFFGLYTINNGRDLVGWLTWPSVTAAEQQVNTGPVSYQTVNVTHNGYQLVPESIWLEAWKSYELIITPEQNGLGCMSTMTIPKLDRTVHKIIKWQQIVYKFDAIGEWTYSVVCAAMGMKHGKIVVQ